MRIILNADDLGFSEKGNVRIFTLLEKGKITSTSIMANGPAFDEAVKKIRAFQNYPVGVHLNVCEFSVLSEPRVFQRFFLADQSGCFNKRIHHVRLSSSLIGAIEREWATQIDKVLQSGLDITHLDSHRHVHTMPLLFRSLKRIQKTFGIYKVRISTNLYPHQYRISSFKSVKKWIWNFSLRHYQKTRTTDYFTSAEWFFADLKRYAPMANKCLELMCHPGQQKDEFDILAKGRWGDAADFPIELIPYSCL